MIPIFKPYMPEGIEKGLSEILYSGKLSYGKYGRMFEDKIKTYISNELFLSISTYNQALLVVLATLDLKPGDEVIASPVSCLASNQPFVSKGIKVVWADIDPFTGTLDIESVKEKITTKTKAIFHNHYCGYLGYVDAMVQLCREYGLYLVDDCVEAFGSTHVGEKSGNLGADISVFSFQTVRLPNTIDGGGLAFRSRELYDRAVMIRDYGIDRSKFRDDMNEINPKCDITVEGFGALMNEVNAFIGVEQFSKLELLLLKQKENARIWREILEGHSKISPMKPVEGTIPNYWVFGVILNTGDKRSILKEFRDKGIYASSVHINNNIYSVFNNTEPLKGVTEFMNKYIALPSGWWFDLDKKLVQL